MYSTRWVMWLSCAVQAYWGVLVLCYGEAVTWITAIHHLYVVGFTTASLGICYLAVAGLACWGMFVRDRMLAVALLMPQQALLIYAAAGAIEAIVGSSFADGVVRSRGFIAADQGVVILLASFHTVALLECPVRELFRQWRKHG